MIKADRIRARNGLCGAGRELHFRLGIQHCVNAARARHCLSHLYNQVGELDQLDQYLRHVAYQRDNVAALHGARVYLHRAGIQYRDYRDIDYGVGGIGSTGK